VPAAQQAVMNKPIVAIVLVIAAAKTMRTAWMGNFVAVQKSVLQDPV